MFFHPHRGTDPMMVKYHKNTIFCCLPSCRLSMNLFEHQEIPREDTRSLQKSLVWEFLIRFNFMIPGVQGGVR